MDRSVVLQKVKKRLPEKRYTHVLGVMASAAVLAKEFGVSEEKANLAAILHDVAKFSDRDWMRSIIIKENMDPRLLDYHAELWHAPVGAYVAGKEFGVTDPDVLNAIRYHTTGRPDMSDLEKIIYIADLVEPGRKFTGVEELRAKKQEGLDEMLTACVRHSVDFLKSKGAAVFPDSLDCLNYYTNSERNVIE
ncbi:bis(5'-nucleosyl)-tetraphosphatase (symmetrical) YqeK [Planococcus lenghuensis]|uniref:bis(5'-nucleosyl)-tetraphosphatase (symmetrical) n=1 Tax=Planococcus lenghuensis TaxID=2213202 RepID=A0A1Q2KXU8_9BACL|nr:bis(5'-nucleosyl)-tetraphosphatase (symmetrical) YqeK [Planococcus lenghuensis]AQQ52946.1 phosphohydrolase [Planococcus lenghuensis]